MPRTKPLTAKPHNALRVLLAGNVSASGKMRGELAKIMHCSEPTVTRRFQNPGSLTLDELLSLGRGLHIPIDELRAAIRY